jgi:5'-nucleotidase
VRILLTNDDGPFAPGLRALHEALAELGEVAVVCPAVQRSGVGHGVSYVEPVRADRLQLREGCEAVVLSGTPADCVKFALLELLPAAPDLVVSGLNMGVNVGVDAFYSGTVAAALEGAFLGIRSVAFSTRRGNADRLTLVASDCVRVLRLLLADWPLGGLAFSVNLPLRGEHSPEVRFVGQSTAFPRGRYVAATDPQGRPYYWLDCIANADPGGWCVRRYCRAGGRGSGDAAAVEPDGPPAVAPPAGQGTGPGRGRGRSRRPREGRKMKYVFGATGVMLIVTVALWAGCSRDEPEAQEVDRQQDAAVAEGPAQGGGEAAAGPAEGAGRPADSPPAESSAAPERKPAQQEPAPRRTVRVPGESVIMAPMQYLHTTTVTAPRRARATISLAYIQNEINQYNALEGRYPASLAELEKWRGEPLGEAPPGYVYRYDAAEGKLEVVPQE